MPKQQVYIGSEGTHYLADILNQIKPKHVLLTTGKRSFKESKYSRHVMQILKQESVFVYDDLSENPTIASIEKAIAATSSKPWDLMIAIGGGSIIDSAKIINYFSGQSSSISQYFSLPEPRSFSVQSSPLVAIPTTAGTGSESTQFATLYHDKKKLSLDQPAILPTYAIVDPVFSQELPKELTAITGVDALSQAIESLWSNNSTPESRALAFEAVKLVRNHLSQAVLNPDSSSRLNMAKGANLAGQAIQMTRTTAAHAASYPLTTYFGIPHGQAVYLTLPYFLKFNSLIGASDCLNPRGPEYVKQTISKICDFFEPSDPEGTKDHLISWGSQLGLKSRLRDFGLKRTDIDIIVENGFTPSRMKNNPRNVTVEDLRHLLEAVY